MKPYSKVNLDGEIIDRGDHEESTLYVVITLDPDDSEIMPPKGDPLSAKEIELFKKWIDEGAKNTHLIFLNDQRKKQSPYPLPQLLIQKYPW